MAGVGLKICGVTRPSDLQTCAEAGVDAVGINLWPTSRRGLAVEEALEMLLEAPTRGLARVGVFVERSPRAVKEVADQLELDAIQWHGDTDPAVYAELGRPWIWVVRGTPALKTLTIPKPLPQWVLLDAAVAGYGGAGVKTDWSWAREAVAWLSPLPVWLAGGITPSNAASAIAQVSPAGLDVASGAEPEGATRGEKDPQAIRELLAATRAASGDVSR